MATDFLLIDGVRLRITQLQEREPVRVGEVVRTFAGPLRSTVRGYQRQWSGSTAGLALAAARDLKHQLALGREVVVTGDSVGGDEIACLPRLTGSRYVHDQRVTNPTQFLEELSFELEEIDAPPRVFAVELTPLALSLTWEPADHVDIVPTFLGLTLD